MIWSRSSSGNRLSCILNDQFQIDPILATPNIQRNKKRKRRSCTRRCVPPLLKLPPNRSRRAAQPAAQPSAPHTQRTTPRPTDSRQQLREHRRPISLPPPEFGRATHFNWMRRWQISSMPLWKDSPQSPALSSYPGKTSWFSAKSRQQYLMSQLMSLH